jgi:exonuclease SbcD
MFKFIHAADIHLDSPLRGLSRYESAPVAAIRNGCRRAFENLVDLAIEEQVEFVVLAGDLYDGDWKDYSTGIFLRRQMGRLAQYDIRVFAVAGNHDAANRMTKSLELPSNMKIFSSAKVESVRLERPGAVVHGRSFASRHVDENLAIGFGPAEKGLFNVGVLHTSLDGRVGHGVYAPCTLDDLRSKGYQYWALGHVHRQEIVAEEPYVVFSGCVQGRHIREAGPKGCVLVSVDGDTVAGIEKIPLDVLRWSLCEVDLTGAKEIREVLERVRRRLDGERAESDGRPLAMRVRLHGATGISEKLAADPERLEQEIRALGVETGEDELWIERVENTCTGRLDLESALADGNPVGRLLQEILHSTGSVEEIEGLADKIAELRQKVPAEALGGDSPLNLDDTQTLERIVGEAKHMLVGRLLMKGGTK